MVEANAEYFVCFSQRMIHINIHSPAVKGKRQGKYVHVSGGADRERL